MLPNEAENIELEFAHITNKVNLPEISHIAQQIQKQMEKMLQARYWEKPQSLSEDDCDLDQSDDFDIKFKPKTNQDRQVSNRAAKEQLQEDKENSHPNRQSRPKSSKDISNDNQKNQEGNNSLSRKRPISSKQTKQRGEEQVSVQHLGKDENERQPQKQILQSGRKQGAGKQRRPKIPKPIVKIVDKREEKEQLRQIEEKLQKISISIKGNRDRERSKSREHPMSRKEILNKELHTPKSSSKKENINRLKLSPIKSMKKIESGIPVYENSSVQPELRVQKEVTRTQELRQMKMQLDEKLKIIESQMEKIDPTANKKLQKIEQKFKVSILEPRETEEQDGLDQQFQRLEKLQNRGQRILDDYLHHRMRLISNTEQADWETGSDCNPPTQS